MKYATCLSDNLVSIVGSEAPSPAAGEIIVRLTLCGVCGTDTAKVFCAYPKPQKLGHEIVGTVHALGEGVNQFALGQRVALAHHVPEPLSHFSRRGSETMDPQFKSSNIDPGGFSEFIRVPALHVSTTVFAIPDAMTDAQAVFMEPLACCLRATDRMNLQSGDSALVIGVGAIGMLFMPLLRELGVMSIAADIRDDQVARARHWGAADGGTREVSDMCKRHTEGRGVDAVILTIVNDATLKLALSSVRDGGTLMLFGGKPNESLQVPFWDCFLREINLVTSYSATPQGLHRAMELLAKPAFSQLETLVSHSFPLVEAQQAFETAWQGRASKVVVLGTG
jgi:L-iditol 2-dehydrogenase